MTTHSFVVKMDCGFSTVLAEYWQYGNSGKPWMALPFLETLLIRGTDMLTTIKILSLEL